MAATQPLKKLATRLRRLEYSTIGATLDDGLTFLTAHLHAEVASFQQHGNPPRLQLPVDELGDIGGYELLQGGTPGEVVHDAGQVIDGIFARFPGVMRVGVSLRKMNLPFPNTCREVEVRITRERPQ